MGYDESTKKSTMKYIKEKQHEIKIRYKKEEYEKMILPAIKKSGMPVASFIKQAVSEKIATEYPAIYDLEYTLDSIKKTIIEVIPSIMSDDCRRIILYGSCARGDFTGDSDVDIAILTESDRNQAKKYNSELDSIASKIGIDTMAVVNFTCLPLEEFEEKKTWYPYFINIDKEGILLYER